MRLSNGLAIVARQISRNGQLNPRGLIFVFAHMRSFSTLLSHQIGSNPDVSGYLEAHQNYRSRLDLIELADKVDRAGANSPKDRYLLDKILHPLIVKDAILQRGDLKAILMVREPLATIRSILNIRAGGISDAAEAADHYVSRLKQLREILDRRSGRVLFIEAEALIENSATTLAMITDYLGLAFPLTEKYEQFPMTGKSKFGDPSEWINKGSIVRNRGGDKVELGANPHMVTACHEYESFCSYARTAAESSVLRESKRSKALVASVESKQFLPQYPSYA